MGYQSKVTDVPQEYAFRNLSGVEARLSVALARPKLIAIGCVIVLAGLGWIELGLMAATPGSWAPLCRFSASGDWSDVALAFPTWAAMTLAMMLPTAGPMLLTYAEIADTAARKRERVVSPLVLAAGYLAVWLGFALAATAL